MTFTQTFLLTISSLLLIGCGGAGANTAPTETKTLNSTILTNVEETTKNQILKVINEARSVARDCHDGRGMVSSAPLLTWSDELYASAYEHAYDLATSNTFSHYGSGTSSDITGSNNDKKSSFIDRIEANGYVDYKVIGENIAGGQKTIETAVEAWLGSPAHCTNLMNSEFKEVGVAVVVNESSDFRIYWTQSFGAKN